MQAVCVFIDTAHTCVERDHLGLVSAPAFEARNNAASPLNRALSSAFKGTSAQKEPRLSGPRHSTGAGHVWPVLPRVADSPPERDISPKLRTRRGPARCPPGVALRRHLRLRSPEDIGRFRLGRAPPACGRLRGVGDQASRRGTNQTYVSSTRETQAGSRHKRSFKPLKLWIKIPI
jgi:hypothetical protein